MRVCIGVRIQFETRVGPLKPGTGGRSLAKLNREVFLADGERTGVNSEMVKLGYYAAQRTLEREVVHEGPAVWGTIVSDRRAARYVRGQRILHVGRFSASAPPRRRRQLSPSPRPPPTTFHRQAHSTHHPRNLPDKLSPLVDGVASHHLYDDVPQRPTAVVSTSSPLQLSWPLPNFASCSNSHPRLRFQS